MRTALEFLFTDTADIWRCENTTKDNITREERKPVALGLPVRISAGKRGLAQQSAGFTKTNPDGNNIQNTFILYLNPETVLLPGDQVWVTQERGRRYRCVAGDPFVYATHQEVPLRDARIV